MKRILLTLTLMITGVAFLNAAPVDLSLARTAAGKYAEARFVLRRQETAPQLVYTGTDGAFYVFNLGSQGFVIIAADDAYRPVIGYSDESTFDADNIPPALADHLDGIAAGINRLRRRGDAVATPMVAAEWESLLSRGQLISRFGGKEGTYFCQTKWNQDYPYNCCCPEDPAGSGGHAIVGCLATAMSQLMRFWAYPVQGIGEHCYTHEDYGLICADFGNTTYDWDHMPNVLNSNSSEEEKLATGTLCFHCGVTIDMGYGPDGSGGASSPIPGVMHTYFNYCDAIVQLRRDDFELETWKTMVREQFDMGWPMYYGGCQDGGCHAFVCDGYDDFDMFHFNLGWGGGSDGWYIIDEAPYTSPADAMFNFVPAEVYDQTPDAPANFTAVAVSDTDLKAHLSWTNPTTKLDGTALTSLQEVVVLRNNRVVGRLTNQTPGATVEFTDEDVPFYDSYHYAVYVVANGRHGRHANVMDVMVGPSCDWKVIMTSENMQGWNGGVLSVYGGSGREVARCSMTNATSTMVQPELPLGMLSFGWTAPAEPVENIGFILKDSEGNTVYSFSGSTDDLPSGVFLMINNSCGGDLSCEVPSSLYAVEEDGAIRLTWDAVPDPGYGYNLYRDGLLLRLLPSATTFLDEEVGMGGHCYQVTVLCDGGENGQFSNESCTFVGPCYPPRNLDFEIAANFKVKLKWESPSPMDGLSGYYLYRKQGDGEYKHIKNIGASATSYTDNSLPEEGDYYYRLYAFYRDWDCMSSPANRANEDNVFELHFYYSPTGVAEEDARWTVVPNPTTGQVTVAGAELGAVTVYNAFGQQVLFQQGSGQRMSLDLSGLSAGVYFLRLVDGDGTCQVKTVVKQE